MLEIKIPEGKDIHKLRKFLKSTNFEVVDIEDRLNDSMVVILDDNIIGFASYTKMAIESQEELDVLLDIILIQEEFRGQYIGDGLIRGILNLIKIRGYKKTFTLVNDENLDFIKKLGFKRIDTNNKIHHNLYSERELEIYSVELEDFFNKPCRSSNF